MPSLIAPTSSAARQVWLAVLLLTVAAIAVDTYAFAAHGPVTALRTMPLDEDAATVDAFCGFAPCGMPLECE